MYAVFFLFLTHIPFGICGNFHKLVDGFCGPTRTHLHRNVTKKYGILDSGIILKFAFDILKIAKYSYFYAGMDHNLSSFSSSDQTQVFRTATTNLLCFL